jgi:hypothetical protein
MTRETMVKYRVRSEAAPGRTRKSQRAKEWWADVLADPRARKRKRRTDLAVKQAFYRLADESTRLSWSLAAA